MNDRNVAALEQLLAGWAFPAESSEGEIEVFRETEENETPAGILARFLAASGVIVPSSLTDEEAEDVADAGFTGDWGRESDFEPAAFRTALEHLAKGEP